MTHTYPQTVLVFTLIWFIFVLFKPRSAVTLIGGLLAVGSYTLACLALGKITLAALGLTLDETLTKLNALKQAIAFSVNAAAAVLFFFSGQVVGPAGLVMAVCSLTGGWLGGRLAGRVKPASLRWIIVTIGVTVAIIYFVRG